MGRNLILGPLGVLGVYESPWISGSLNLGLYLIFPCLVLSAPNSFLHHYQIIPLLKLSEKLSQETRTHLPMPFLPICINNNNNKNPQILGFLENLSFSCSYGYHPDIALAQTYILSLSKYGKFFSTLSGTHISSIYYDDSFHISSHMKPESFLWLLGSDPSFQILCKSLGMVMNRCILYSSLQLMYHSLSLQLKPPDFKPMSPDDIAYFDIQIRNS